MLKEAVLNASHQSNSSSNSTALYEIRLNELEKRLEGENRLSYVDIIGLCQGSLEVTKTKNMVNVQPLTSIKKLEYLYSSKEYAQFVGEFRRFLKSSNNGGDGIDENLLRQLGKSILLSVRKDRF